MTIYLAWACVIFLLILTVYGPVNVLIVGATRKGKTLSAARNAVESKDESCVLLDPHKESLAAVAVTHLADNVLYDRLSDVRSTLGFNLLSASKEAHELVRAQENQRRAETFVDMLLRRRN